MGNDPQTWSSYLDFFPLPFSHPCAGGCSTVKCTKAKTFTTPRWITNHCAPSVRSNATSGASMATHFVFDTFWRIQLLLSEDVHMSPSPASTCVLRPFLKGNSASMYLNLHMTLCIIICFVINNHYRYLITVLHKFILCH